MRLISLLLLLGAVTASYGMNCYVCDSLTDPGCEDDYNTPIKHLTACPAHLSDGCSKEKSGVKVDGSPEIKVKRSCGKQFETSPCRIIKGKDVKGRYNMYFYACSCTGEGCNSASGLSLTFSLLAAALVKHLV